jgi:tRNA-dihydrouridine synthase B
MIVRGRWGNPWIFERARGLIHEGKDIPPPPWQERKKLAFRHLEMLLQSKGVPWEIIAFIKHLGWYVRVYPAAAEFRKRINTIRSKEAFIREIEVYFCYVEAIQGGVS